MTEIKRDGWITVTVRSKGGSTCRAEGKELPFGLRLIAPWPDSPYGDQWLIESQPVQAGPHVGTWRGNAAEALKVVDLLRGLERRTVAA